MLFRSLGMPSEEISVERYQRYLQQGIDIANSDIQWLSDSFTGSSQRD